MPLIARVTALERYATAGGAGMTGGPLKTDNQAFELGKPLSTAGGFGFGGGGGHVEGKGIAGGGNKLNLF